MPAKLGFDVKLDQSLPNCFRWLTVSPKGQPELEIILLKLGSGCEFVKKNDGMAEKGSKDIETMVAPVNKRWFSAGAFQTADCRKMVEELKAKV
jgi:hypothetical protein